MQQVELVQEQGHELTQKTLRDQLEVLDVHPSWDMHRTSTTCFSKIHAWNVMNATCFMSQGNLIPALIPLNVTLSRCHIHVLRKLKFKIQIVKILIYQRYLYLYIYNSIYTKLQMIQKIFGKTCAFKKKQTICGMPKCSEWWMVHWHQATVVPPWLA